jgi:hypothetical protein
MQRARRQTPWVAVFRPKRTEKNDRGESPEKSAAANSSNFLGASSGFFWAPIAATPPQRAWTDERHAIIAHTARHVCRIRLRNGARQFFADGCAGRRRASSAYVRARVPISFWGRLCVSAPLSCLAHSLDIFSRACRCVHANTLSLVFCFVVFLSCDRTVSLLKSRYAHFHALWCRRGLPTMSCPPTHTWHHLHHSPLPGRSAAPPHGPRRDAVPRAAQFGGRQGRATHRVGRLGYSWHALSYCLQSESRIPFNRINKNPLFRTVVVRQRHNHCTDDSRTFATINLFTDSGRVRAMPCSCHCVKKYMKQRRIILFFMPYDVTGIRRPSGTLTL